jgi:hypothetical protein
LRRGEGRRRRRRRRSGRGRGRRRDELIKGRIGDVWERETMRDRREDFCI